MKYSRSFTILILFIAIISCSTAEKTVKTGKAEFQGRKNDLKTLDIKGSISSSFKDESNSAMLRIYVSATDSVSLTLIGPMGVPVGKLFATPNYFIFYNTINNEALQGSPTSENLQEALMLPLSFEEFIRLTRGETPGKPESFTLDTTVKGKKVYRNFTEKQYVEYVVISEENNIAQYQRKLRDGTLILNVYYSDFDYFQDFRLAKSITYEFPALEGRITLHVDNYKINEITNKPYSFTLPKSIKVNKID